MEPIIIVAIVLLLLAAGVGIYFFTKKEDGEEEISYDSGDYEVEEEGDYDVEDDGDYDVGESDSGESDSAEPFDPEVTSEKNNIFLWGPYSIRKISGKDAVDVSTTNKDSTTAQECSDECSVDATCKGFEFDSSTNSCKMINTINGKSGDKAWIEPEENDTKYLYRKVHKPACAVAARDVGGLDPKSWMYKQVGWNPTGHIEWQCNNKNPTTVDCSAIKDACTGIKK